MNVPEVTNILNNPESRDGVGFWVLDFGYSILFSPALAGLGFRA
jgi:hypothetical protein